MRLPQFIESHMEAILVEWEAFAKTLYPAASGMTTPLLRDHAQQILEVVVTDLSTSQTAGEQAQKSVGKAPNLPDAPKSAAEIHAVQRVQSGIDINQLAAEYRALRASVLRLWEDEFDPGAESLQDVIRFNEAIDQALAESISIFAAQVDRSRNLLLGMLGHDMRNPLNAVLMTAASLAELNAGEEVSEAAGLLIRSGASIQALLNDLVDFNRTSLGLGLNIRPGEADLAALFEDELEQHRVTNPRRPVELTVTGNVKGVWDGRRLQQVLRNLLSNATAYGTESEPVRVSLEGDASGVRVAVKNRGGVIPPAAREQLFDPLKRGDTQSTGGNKQGLGLGLFIVREIARAHGGEVDLKSDTDETVFSVSLPRTSSPRKDAPAPAPDPGNT